MDYKFNSLKMASGSDIANAVFQEIGASQLSMVIAVEIAHAIDRSTSFDQLEDDIFTNVIFNDEEANIARDAVRNLYESR